MSLRSSLWTRSRPSRSGAIRRRSSWGRRRRVDAECPRRRCGTRRRRSCATAPTGVLTCAVHARGRGRPLRATPPWPVRTCSSRRAGSRPTPSSGSTHAAANSSHSTQVPPGSPSTSPSRSRFRRAIPGLFAALGITPTEFLRTDGSSSCASSTTGHRPDTCTRLRPARSSGRRSGVYVTAPGDEGYDIVSRCFAPAVGITRTRVTGSMHCVLVAYWGPRLGRDELHAFQASARGGEVAVVREGDRALLTGRCATVLAGELRA